MFRKFLFVTLLFALLVSACATNGAAIEPAVAVTEASAQISAVDGLGRTVTLSAPASKVVSLSP